jgi:hypothetical protein
VTKVLFKHFNKAYRVLKSHFIDISDHRAGRIEEVKALSLHEDFQKLSVEVAAISYGYIISKFSQN